MPKALLTHLPHVAFFGAGVLAFLWAWWRDGPASRPESEGPAKRPKRRSVRLSVARRGLLILGPLLGAAGTGAVIYGMNLGGGRAGGGVIWVHAGISLLAFLLVVYKLGSAGFSLGRLRHGLKSERIAELLSLLLAAVMIPLLATGIALLIAPSKGSFAAYSHLVASAWWTGLLLWHLRRYLAAAVREVLRPSAFPAAAD